MVHADMERMLADIRFEAELTRHLTGYDRFDDRVMAAMARVPRHVFVGPDSRRYAYDNNPLTIGYGQTISQPYIVALMTQLAHISAADRILEIGTGCGYQTAILAELAQEVYTIEIIPELACSAAERLQLLGYEKIHARQGDGYYGWSDCAPFDAVLVTAAAHEIPPPLLEQLKPGGRLVIPVAAGVAQELQLVRKEENGRILVRDVLSVVFVPLTGKH